MPSINYEIHLTLIWSTNRIISEGKRVTTFAIKDKQLYVPVVVQDNTNLLQQLNSGFKSKINCNKYEE